MTIIRDNQLNRYIQLGRVNIVKEDIGQHRAARRLNETLWHSRTISLIGSEKRTV